MLGGRLRIDRKRLCFCSAVIRKRLCFGFAGGSASFAKGSVFYSASIRKKLCFGFVWAPRRFAKGSVLAPREAPHRFAKGSAWALRRFAKVSVLAPREALLGSFFSQKGSAKTCFFFVRFVFSGGSFSRVKNNGADSFSSRWLGSLGSRVCIVGGIQAPVYAIQQCQHFQNKHCLGMRVGDQFPDRLCMQSPPGNDSQMCSAAQSPFANSPRAQSVFLQFYTFFILRAEPICKSLPAGLCMAEPVRGMVSEWPTNASPVSETSTRLRCVQRWLASASLFSLNK